MVDVVEQARDLVTRSGETRYRICQETGLDEGAMSRFMSGERGMTISNLQRLLAYFNAELRIVPMAKGKKGRG